MTNFKIENPWNIQSIYDLQYFRCPSCEYCDNSKQQFVNHAYESHPNCIDYLLNIKDGSFDDILCPWDSIDIKLEKHLSVELTEDSYENQNNESFELDFDTHKEENDFKDIKLEDHFKVELTENSLKSENEKTKEESKRIYKCDKCDLKYSSKSSLNRHKGDFHEGKEIIYDCKLCDKSYAAKQKLNEHISNIHHGIRRFQCDKCDKAYTDQRNLSIHINNYHKENQKPKKVPKKNFKCEICSQMCSTKGTLKRHHG